MSERDERDAIGGSLRRQFAPPPLDELVARVAAAAQRVQDGAPLDAEVEADDDAPPSSPAVVAALDERSAANEPPGRSWRIAAGVAVVSFLAAALVLVLRPSLPDPGDGTHQTSQTRDDASRYVAGAQLERFLQDDARLPGDEGSCAAEPPPPSCATDHGPVLEPTPRVRMLGECGGDTGVGCELHDLPAGRALLVRLEPSGDRAIVCIETAATDPRPLLPEASGYTIFRRTLGEYVLYEVTPLDRPQALEHMRL